MMPIAQETIPSKLRGMVEVMNLTDADQCKKLVSRMGMPEKMAVIMFRILGEEHRAAQMRGSEWQNDAQRALEKAMPDDKVRSPEARLVAIYCLQDEVLDKIISVMEEVETVLDKLSLRMADIREKYWAVVKK